MIHLVAFANISGKQYAYDYCAPDNEYEKIIAKKQEMMQDASDESKNLFTFHLIPSDDASFESIQQADPYFANTQLCETFDDFLSTINSEGKLTSKDIASYLLRKYKLLRQRRFAFHKILYYIYADFLVDHHYPLFTANFVAFEQGPVEYDIYQLEKQNQQALLGDASLELKLQMSPNRKPIIELIDQDVRKYQDYFNNVWINNHGHDANYNPDTVNSFV